MTLHCYTDDCDTVIAESVEDANRAWEAWSGPSGVHDPEAWDQVPDEQTITIHCDASGAPSTPGDGGVGPVTKTAAEWAAGRGRGFLCTTEW